MKEKYTEEAGVSAFIHVADLAKGHLAKGHLAALNCFNNENTTSGCHAFNLGTGVTLATIS
jgi:UDP-glucose 4-epimerase